MDYMTIALILFALGLVLLGLEVMLPTGGICVVISLLFFGSGVCVILAQGSTIEAVAAIVGLAIGLPVAGSIAVSAWKRMSISSVLAEPPEAIAVPVGEFESLKNRTGKTVSPMRPSGVVEIEGRRVDAMTEGVMLDAGVWVRCVDIKRGQVIVRQIESPLVSDDLASEPVEFESPPVREIAPEPEPSKPEKPKDDLDLDLD